MLDANVVWMNASHLMQYLRSGAPDYVSGAVMNISMQPVIVNNYFSSHRRTSIPFRSNLWIKIWNRLSCSYGYSSFRDTNNVDTKFKIFKLATQEKFFLIILWFITILPLTAISIAEWASSSALQSSNYCCEPECNGTACHAVSLYQENDSHFYVIWKLD